MPSGQKSDVASSLSKLTLDGDKKPAKPAKKAKKPVVDSWEDEDLDDDDEEEEAKPPGGDGSKAPPPTPHLSHVQHGVSLFSPTDAVARRMIASALGVKVPKQTEEQKAYDRAVREQERKRREEEKAAERKKQEEMERAKAAIWED
ncbi:hypothetical protein CGLO_04926 [Colletotrichum gloeosporioides Cg-14]|uniref:Uncharacterized protein n=1 Tax=Colletotrichum gloeosporioides (strain Cg-14) TaxID=1237896 RepID=T0KR86_COLGC|nr:hypothetical protein CGLO_04926 [Colletotrichum gloeosporioides Cg-14]